MPRVPVGEQLLLLGAGSPAPRARASGPVERPKERPSNCILDLYHSPVYTSRPDRGGINHGIAPDL